VSRLAAIVAAVLLANVAALQIGVAAGAPLGEFVWGGTNDGVLPTDLRVASAIAVPVLLVVAWVLLARAGVVPRGVLPARILAPACWVLFALFALNTLGNLASESGFERLIFAPVTALLAALSAVVARRGPDPAALSDLPAPAPGGG
jgi:hypothetical protein